MSCLHFLLKKRLAVRKRFRVFSRSSSDFKAKLPSSSLLMNDKTRSEMSSTDSFMLQLLLLLLLLLLAALSPRSCPVAPLAV